jgi:hypothetical protein
MSGPTTDLVVYGPFPVPYDSPGTGTSKRIGRTHSKEFWDQPELRTIRRKQGCYIFALATGRGHTPWYVGKATKSFHQEALTDHKLVYYNDVVYNGRKGRPVMFFVGRPDNLVKVPKKQIDDMETYLVQTAAYKNGELKNRYKRRVPQWGIRGVVRGGRGRATTAAKRFRGMMGL